MSMDLSDIFSPRSANALDSEAKSFFDEFDNDRGGEISADELGTAIRMLGLNPTMKELQNAIKKMDRNGNGMIEYDEFLAFLKRSYNSSDEDSTGKTVLSDYVSTQSPNGGGQIKFDEFLSYLKRYHRNTDEDSNIPMELSDICSSQNEKALIVEARSIFHEFDKDKNGVISSQEMGTALRMLGLNPTMKEVQNMINEIDQNGDGMVDFDDFLTFLRRSYKKPDEVKTELKKAFQVFDMNKDGFISREELHSVLTKMGEQLTEEEVDEMMEEADKNGDGKIDYEEYVETMYPKES